MNGQTAKGSIGSVNVITTNGRGFTPEELATRLVDKIVYLGDGAHPEIAAQVRAFREQLYRVVLFYMKDMVASHNVTLSQRLIEAGHPELVRFLEP
jgi:hypothetical protein